MFGSVSALLISFPHSLKTQMAYVQHQEGELEKRRLHCMLNLSSSVSKLLLTLLSQTSELSMPSRVRLNFSAHETNLVITFLLAVGVMLKEPNWAQSFIPDHASLSKVRRSILRRINPSNDASTRPAKRKRDSRTTPLIKADEWAVRVVDDVDMKKFGCRDRHVARCVIL